MDRCNISTNVNLGAIEYNWLETRYYLIAYLKNDLELWCDYDFEFPRIYLVRNTDKRRVPIIMMIDLAKPKGSPPDNIFEIISTKISRKYQGFNIAPMIYEKILQYTGWYIGAGQEQSPGGRGIWYNLGKLKNISLVGMDRIGRLFDVEPDDEKRELACEERSVYDSYQFQVYARAL
jgi:hypothetical protein